MDTDSSYSNREAYLEQLLSVDPIIAQTLPIDVLRDVEKLSHSSAAKLQSLSAACRKEIRKRNKQARSQS